MTRLLFQNEKVEPTPAPKPVDPEPETIDNTDSVIIVCLYSARIDEHDSI